MFDRFVLVWICRFPLPLDDWEGLRFVIVALPRLFSYLFLFYEAICFKSCLVLFCSCVFSFFSIAITSLGEERANLSAFCTFVRFALVWFCLFHRPLGVWEGLRLVIVTPLGLFSYLFLKTKKIVDCVLIRVSVVIGNSFVTMKCTQCKTVQWLVAKADWPY